MKSRANWFMSKNVCHSFSALVLRLSRLDVGTQKATGPILTLPAGLYSVY